MAGMEQCIDGALVCMGAVDPTVEGCDCSDNDCDGCCTENCKETGFLIDLETHTLEKFGVEQGIVEWACLDCE